MIIISDGKRRKTGVMNAHGYVCDAVELNASDFRHLKSLYENDARGFNAWLQQMTVRFPDNRYPNIVETR